MNVCVYCASSTRISPAYAEAAENLGRLLAEKGHALVYGGGNVGLMGHIARAVHAAGGHVYGVIPAALHAREGIAYGLADELVVTDTMQERKKLMFTRADGFVVLPGGIGTLEEFMEVLTLRALGYHNKPIALLSTDGFYDTLMAFFGQLGTEGFLRDDLLQLFHLVSTPEEALAVITRSAA